MTALAPLYPPGPAGVPPELTRVPAAYRLRVLAMIGGLFLFLVVYAAVIAAAALLAYWLVTFPMSNASGRGSVMVLIVKFGGGLAAGLVCVFLLKGLFKGRRVERSHHLEVTADEHPELFAFIRRVYADTGSRRPRRVYVSPDVNAALIYDTSLLNLVVPPRKDLLIGLGLVNVVNLTEFKAVLAHEFGHFAQRSVGLGSYLYVANRVMHDVIYSRDALDRFVDGWCSLDLRLSFPAWGLKGTLWVIRKTLAGVFRGINLLDLSLSRQMEYNADNVAVSVTGSDALIEGLSRLDFAQECLAGAAQSLSAAADHGLQTDDLFFHQARTAERVWRLRNDPTLGLPPPRSTDPAAPVVVFPPEENGVPEKYQSHPANSLRERNAKRFYLDGPRDDRSPWLLFGDAAATKRAATAVFYRFGLQRNEAYRPRPAAEVQAFVDAEHAETTYDPRYHGVYDDRIIDPGDVRDLPAAWPADRLGAFFADWPPADLKDRVAVLNERRAEFNLLDGLKSGQLGLRGKTFTLRGVEYTARDVNRLHEQLDGEMKAAHGDLEQLDRQAFLAHWSLARRLDAGDGGMRETDLLDRYRFHVTAQTLLQMLLHQNARLHSWLQFLSTSPQLEEGAFREIQEALRGVRAAVLGVLDEAEAVRTPGLTNVPAGTDLASLIEDRGDNRLPPLKGDNISGEWVTKLVNRTDGVLSRLKRVHFKSLGSLLAAQEQLASAWTAADGPAAAGLPITRRA